MLVILISKDESMVRKTSKNVCLLINDSKCVEIESTFHQQHIKRFIFSMLTIILCLLSLLIHIWSVQFSSVTQSCLTLCDPVNRSMPGFRVHHQLPEFTQTHVHRVSDAIQPSHPLSSPSPPTRNPSQQQGLIQWVNTSHEVAKVLEFHLQHQSFQWKPKTDLF